MMETTSTPGATSRVTSQLTAPWTILINLPLRMFRALIFMTQDDLSRRVRRQFELRRWTEADGPFAFRDNRSDPYTGNALAEAIRTRARNLASLPLNASWLRWPSRCPARWWLESELFVPDVSARVSDVAAHAGTRLRPSIAIASGEIWAEI